MCAVIEQTRRDANEAELAELRTQLRAANVASHKASAVQPQHCSEVNDCACHSVSERSSLALLMQVEVALEEESSALADARCQVQNLEAELEQVGSRLYSTVTLLLTSSHHLQIPTVPRVAMHSQHVCAGMQTAAVMAARASGVSVWVVSIRIGYGADRLLHCLVAARCVVFALWLSCAAFSRRKPRLLKRSTTSCFICKSVISVLCASRLCFANTAQPLSAFPFLAEQVCLRAYGPALETQNSTKYETK